MDPEVDWGKKKILLGRRKRNKILEDFVYIHLKALFNKKVI